MAPDSVQTKDFQKQMVPHLDLSLEKVTQMAFLTENCSVEATSMELNWAQTKDSQKQTVFRTDLSLVKLILMAFLMERC